MTNRLRKDLHFAQLPEWVLFHDDLSPQAIRLYAVLVRRADQQNQCFPSRTTLATDLRVNSAKTVDRALKELVDADAVTVTPRFDSAGDSTSNLYTVHLTPPEGVASRMSPPLDISVPPGGVTDVPTGGDKSDALTRASSKKTPLPPASPGADTDIDNTPRPVGNSKAGSNLEQPGCSAHPDRPSPNCRGCGTSPRSVARQAEREAAEQRRRESDAEIQADRRRKAETARVDAEAHAAQARQLMREKAVTRG